MCIRDSCKPVPVPLRAAVIHLDRPLLTGSSDLPGSSAGRAVPSSPIWSCSAWGFPCRQNYSCRGALLPHHFTLTPPCGEAVYFLWHFPSSPCEPARPLAGTLPCGDRTFLSRGPECAPGATARPAASLEYSRTFFERSVLETPCAGH